jgi:hypothetical protein
VTKIRLVNFMVDSLWLQALLCNVKSKLSHASPRFDRSPTYLDAHSSASRYSRNRGASETRIWWSTIKNPTPVTNTAHPDGSGTNLIRKIPIASGTAPEFCDGRD